MLMAWVIKLIQLTEHYFGKIGSFLLYLFLLIFNYYQKKKNQCQYVVNNG